MSASEPGARGYGRGAAVLSVGIGITGLVTYTYFSLASHALSDDEYGRISLLWSATFVVVSVLYRPVEQLLSRTIAERDAHGETATDHLRTAAKIQLALAALFAGAGLLAREPLQNDLFDGSATLYWILIVTILAYAASYYARGFLAGHRRFGFYGSLVLLEATTRCSFALAVTIGITEGQSAVALGMAVAPLVSMAVVPLALTRGVARAGGRDGAVAGRPEGGRCEGAVVGQDPPADAPHSGGFTAAVVGIMLAEQALLNAGPLLVNATGGAALAGFTFNVLLIARAPLQLFQSVQASILPHLTEMRATGATARFRRSVNVTLAGVAAFSAAVALAMLALGPQLMDLLFGAGFDYGRGGLVLVALGMGLYLAAATLNQAALAQARARQAAACWLAVAAGFVGFLAFVEWDDRVEQVETAFAGAALVLCTLLYGLYRRA